MNQSIIEKSFDRINSLLDIQPEEYLTVDSNAQELFYIVNKSIRHHYKISTARNGIGNREGSNQTPSGIHRIVEKIGADAPEGAIFRDRLNTGEIWHPGLTEENLILSRILRLKGLEEGVNVGSGIDTYERYIYIHGTNQEMLIGTPISHGCICMKNSDIIALFDMIEEDTLVVIN